VRSRTWCDEFRELVLMCAVHNIKQSLGPLNQVTSGDSLLPFLQKPISHTKS
jgi:hypothetical protein